MTAEFAGDAAKMKIASIHDLCLRLVINGAEVTVDAREIDLFNATADRVTDYAVSELRKLRDRLNNFGEAVHDHKDNGGFPADFPLTSAVDDFCREQIRLTRGYWRTTNKIYDVALRSSTAVNVWRKEELTRVAMARAVRIRVHLRKSKAKLCPPIQSTAADTATAEQGGFEPSRVENRLLHPRLLKTPIAHILRFLTPRPQTIQI